MTIYILDQDLTKAALYLDNKNLDKCIEDIAQVLKREKPDWLNL